MECNVPTLGTKHSQTGNETFPSWENFSDIRLRGLSYFFATFTKNLSSLNKSLKTRINTGDLEDERFFASLPHLSCISPEYRREIWEMREGLGRDLKHLHHLELPVYKGVSKDLGRDGKIFYLYYIRDIGSSESRRYAWGVRRRGWVPGSLHPSSWRNLYTKVGRWPDGSSESSRHHTAASSQCRWG